MCQKRRLLLIPVPGKVAGFGNESTGLILSFLMHGGVQGELQKAFFRRLSVASNCCAQQQPLCTCQHRCYPNAQWDHDGLSCLLLASSGASAGLWGCFLDTRCGSSLGHSLLLTSVSADILLAETFSGSAASCGTRDHFWKA